MCGFSPIFELQLMYMACSRKLFLLLARQNIAMYMITSSLNGNTLSRAKPGALHNGLITLNPFLFSFKITITPSESTIVYSDTIVLSFNTRRVISRD